MRVRALPRLPKPLGLASASVVRAQLAYFASRQPVALADGAWRVLDPPPGYLLLSLLHTLSLVLSHILSVACMYTCICIKVFELVACSSLWILFLSFSSRLQNTIWCVFCLLFVSCLFLICFYFDVVKDKI